MKALEVEGNDKLNPNRQLGFIGRSAHFYRGNVTAVLLVVTRRLSVRELGGRK